MLANLCLHCTQGSEQAPLCFSSDFKMVEVDGFEPPRPRRAQDLQSRAIDRYAIPPKYKFQDAREFYGSFKNTLRSDSPKNVVRVTGLEPARLSTVVSKTTLATITTHPQ